MAGVPRSHIDASRTNLTSYHLVHHSYVSCKHVLREFLICIYTGTHTNLTCNDKSKFPQEKQCYLLNESQVFYFKNSLYLSSIQFSKF